MQLCTHKNAQVLKFFSKYEKFSFPTLLSLENKLYFKMIVLNENKRHYITEAFNFTGETNFR